VVPSRFKEVLAGYLLSASAFFGFHSCSGGLQVLAWLLDEGIEPAEVIR
jgi:hypothetical protein